VIIFISDLEYHYQMKEMASNSKLNTDCVNKNANCNQNYKALEWQKEKGKRKSEKLYEDYKTQTSICVAPLPKTITKEQLISFMCKFGRILKSHMGKNFFLIEYETK